MEFIYLDHAATSPVHKDVLQAMLPFFTEVYGNPSSVHAYGRQARKHLNGSRREIAKSIHAEEKEIIFTSGGTEATNLALVGTALANKHRGNHIITSNQEHQATLHATLYLEELGFEITYLPTDESGRIRVEDIRKHLRKETIIVSIIFVNNETGIIQPIKEIGKQLINHQAYFHVDAVQAYELIDINVEKLNIDLLTVSSHKINGPKGVGFLFAKQEIVIQQRQFGGEQERKRRPGTENLTAIVGFQTAVELLTTSKQKLWKKYEGFKNLFVKTLEEAGIAMFVNGDSNNCIPSILNISFPGTKVESLLTNLDMENIAASSGSACTAGSVAASHVLVAMYGEDDERTMNSIRFSFGINNTEENVKE